MKNNAAWVRNSSLVLCNLLLWVFSVHRHNLLFSLLKWRNHLDGRRMFYVWWWRLQKDSLLVYFVFFSSSPIGIVEIDANMCRMCRLFSMTLILVYESRRKQTGRQWRRRKSTRNSLRFLISTRDHSLKVSWKAELFVLSRKSCNNNNCIVNCM